MRSDLLADDRRSRARQRVLVAAAALAGVAAVVTLSREMVTRGASPVYGGAPLRERDAKPPAAAADAQAPSALPDASAPRASSPAALRTRPLSAWLADVARDAGRDLVISPDLRGDLTASESESLDWLQRLQAYARVFGFTFAVGEGHIEVSRREEPRHSSDRSQASGKPADSHTQARLDRTAEPAAVAAPAPAAGDPSLAAAVVPGALGEPPPHTRVLRLAHESAKETAAVLAHAGKALDVTVTADPSANALVFSGQPAAISRVVGVAGELDRPHRRILLEAKIVEVLRSARLDFGVEWKLTGTTVGGDVRFPPPVTDAGSAALVVATHGAAALDARISALEAGGKLRVVSRPSVVMVEGSPATIESVRILRIRLPSNGTVVGDDVVQTSNGRATEDIPVGVRLEVTPAIRAGGRVLLRIKAKSSSLGQPLPPDNIPEELSRMVDAEVVVADGETAVLGGLSRESGSRGGAGVPGLRRIPGVGALFGRKSRVSEEEELVVLVTPRLLD